MPEQLALDPSLPAPRSSATFSLCRTWRYLLTREWDPALPKLNIIGLNPSTADERQDDPTIRRCIGFARTWGYGGLAMTNLFGLRSTDPRVLYAVEDPVGPDNDFYLVDTARRAGLVVAAWGNHGSLHGRSGQVVRLLAEAGIALHCFGRTMTNEPRHPLYLPGSAKTEAFG